MKPCKNSAKEREVAPASLPQAERALPVLSRRETLLSAAACLLPTLSEAETSAPARYTLPGPFRGRVVEVSHARVLNGSLIARGALRDMMAQGLMRLTGEKSETAAWRRFIEPEDVVGIKGCPVGRPHAIAHAETLSEVMRGLMLAGVQPQNILIFERYDNELRAGGYHKILPPGARIASGSPYYDDIQLRTAGYSGTTIRGYDTKTFVAFPRRVPGADAKNPAHLRSHLLQVVSHEVNKVINVCALKDHTAAGLTIALKNMSHGFVNNVRRSHAGSNTTGDFIPTVVCMPAIREKVVLHICDALWGVYDGGPGAWNPNFRSWAYRSLLFATDPVAMDRIGWTILDRKRRSAGLPPIADCGKRAENPGHEEFAHRQPDHVLRAGRKGLGEANLDRITRLSIKL